MAKESDKSEEIMLKAIDAAIASLRAQDWDLNPYSIAAAAELAPESVFGNKAAMDKIMLARGDGSTYSYDSELAGRCKELTAELDNATVINQDLFDRGSELAERVVELEASVSELEQEAETLALQLQNSWSIGYQKGLAEGREKALAELPKLPLEEKPAEKSVVTKIANLTEAEPNKTKISARAEERSFGSDTDEDLPVEETLHTYAETPVVSNAQSRTQALPEPGVGPVAPVPTQAQPAPLKAATYNDQNYNAVNDHRSPINVSEVYGSLSWKQIETVYQYSAVAGRPNTNLYFEPLNPAEIVEVEAAPAATPTPAPAEAEPTARNRKKSSMPDISFDPPDEPIVSGTTSGAAANSNLSFEKEPEKSAAPSADEIYQLDYVNQYDGGLTGENYPNLGAMQAASGNGRKLDNRVASATFDKLDALPASDHEVPDILDLDQLDIFEGLEDIHELSNIEVIEDVIITPSPEEVTKARVASQSETAAMPKVSNEDLRDLIKTRIKQAQGDDPSQLHSVDQLLEAAGASAANSTSATGADTSSGTSHAGAATGETPGSAAIDLEAIRHGARNKFVGGKTATPAAAGSGAASVTGETTVTMPPANPPLPRVAPVPPDIRKHCMILGVRPEELTTKIIIEAWKAQIAAPGVHPDQGGDTETAVYLNLAKDTLVKWVENQAPKLGKKFGQQGHKDTDKK